MNITYYQQGDTILKPIGIFGVFEKEYAEIPEDAKEIEGNLLLKGNTNSHALYGGEFVLSEKDGVIFLEVIESTILDHVKDHLSAKPKHAEHHAQTIDVGQYFLSPLMEYDHIKEESRRVID